MSGLVQDLRYAVRALGNNPGFTAVALLTLALGIGANTAIFSIVHGALLRPLRYPAPEQLMHFDRALSVAEYQEFRRINRSFANVGAYTTGIGVYTTSEVNLTASDRPLRVRSISVDAHLLRTLAIQPAQGRFFTDDETRFGTGGLARPVAILSHELWEAAFARQPVIGKTTNIGGRTHEIVGVMPSGVDLMDNRTAVWLPIGAPAAIRDDRTNHIVQVIGRLKQGVTGGAAQAELRTMLERWAERAGASGHVPTNRPSGPADHALELQPMHDAIIADARSPLWALQVAVGFVLLIGCANLANLHLARAESRRREFAVRAALGASRSRLLRQMLTESLLLAGAGCVLGVGFAAATVRTIGQVYAQSLPRFAEVTIDGPVLLFALCVSIVTGLLFGLAPLGQTRLGAQLATGLRSGGYRDATNAGRPRIRGALVVAEVALTVMLLTTAGLLIRSAYQLANVDAGFDRSNLVTFSLTLAEPYDPDTRALAYQRILDRLRAVPGVQSAALMSGLPPKRSLQAVSTRIENYTASDGRPVEIVDYYQLVMGDYFRTMGISIVAGRGFDATDVGSQAKVVVINETLARKVWRSRDPIGQRLRVNLGAAAGLAGNPWHTVVGVARDIKQGGVEREVGTEIYVFLDQVALAAPTMNAVLRTTLPPAAIARTLDTLVRDIDPNVPVVRLQQMDSAFTQAVGRPRFLAQLLATFAALALLLAIIGIYGVLSYLIAERRREIGIRMALGAHRAKVIGLVMKDGLILTAVGALVGIAGSVSASRLMTTLLFGVQPTDPMTIMSVIVAITLASALACYLPARRAARVDPLVALRYE
jgi:predicted permease